MGTKKQLLICLGVGVVLLTGAVYPSDDVVVQDEDVAVDVLESRESSHPCATGLMPTCRQSPGDVCIHFNPKGEAHEKEDHCDPNDGCEPK